MGLIPTEKLKPQSSRLHFLLIIGPPKIGTTEALLQLPNSLHIDLQSGASHYSGVTVDIAKIARTARIRDKNERGEEIERNMRGRYEALKYVLRELKEKKEKEKFIYDFISIDPAGSLDEISEERGLELYQTSAYKRKDADDPTKIVKLDVGFNKGVEMNQIGFEEIINEFRKYCHTIILKVHGKDNITIKRDVELTMEVLDLPKGIGGWLAKECDAIGSMYRLEGNINKISFLKSDRDPLLGARAPHLKNKIVEISKLNEEGELITYWETIFPHIKQPVKQSITKQEKTTQPHE